MHQSLKHWDWFYPRLKNFETLLMNHEKRQRMVYSCVKDSAHSMHVHKFDNWSLTLYEPRWKCVVSFLKSFVDILDILVETFDAKKYLAAADAKSCDPQTDVVAGDVDVANEDTPFSARKLSLSRIEACLKDNFFVRYTHLVLQADSVPEFQLAAYCEACLCHENYLHHSTDYKRRQVMEEHYGSGTRTCVAAGWKAPELAAG